MFPVGFFKISIQNREGFVLIDPGLALERPIVIMEDRQDPHFGEFVCLEVIPIVFVYNSSAFLYSLQFRIGIIIFEDNRFFIFTRNICINFISEAEEKWKPNRPQNYLISTSGFALATLGSSRSKGCTLIWLFVFRFSLVASSLW